MPTAGDVKEALWLSTKSFDTGPKPGTPYRAKLTSKVVCGVSQSGVVIAAPIGQLAAPNPFGFGTSSLVAVVNDNPAGFVILTASGKAKHVTLKDLATAAQKQGTIIELADDDTIAAVAEAGGETLVVVSSDSNVMTCDASTVPTQGPDKAGVKGMNLKAGAEVVAAFIPKNAASETLAVLSKDGVKVTPLSELPVKGRGTGGVRVAKTLSPVLSAAVGVEVAGAAGKRKSALPDPTERGKKWDDAGSVKAVAAW